MINPSEMYLVKIKIRLNLYVFFSVNMIICCGKIQICFLEKNYYVIILREFITGLLFEFMLVLSFKKNQRSI